jgi:hypothetical protein
MAESVGLESRGNPAVKVGSVDRIIPPGELRCYLADAAGHVIGRKQG